MPTGASDNRAREGHGARNEGEQLVVIANPNAGGGRAGASRARVEAAVSRAFARAEVWWTEAPGHAVELAQRAAEAGADLVAALGGDGTCNEVVNGLMGEGGPRSPKTIFTTLPFGTGGDLVRTLQMPRDLSEALWVVSTGTTVHVDVGRVQLASGARRWFINVAGAGANAEVCVRVNRSSKRFGGELTFLGAILTTVRDFEPRRVGWRWEGPDGAGEVELDTLAAFVANAHYCGAGMYVGKGGSMADGAFDVTLVPRMGLAGAVMALPHTRTGDLDRVPGVVRFRAHRVELLGALPIETDGEPRGDGPATFTCLARPLQVRGAWRRPPTPL